MDLGLGGKTALVTGSYRGTGAGIARVLAREGASVLVHGFADGEPDRVVDEIRAAGDDARAVVGVRLIRGLAPGMRAAGWGRILLVGSLGALRPGARMPAYYASKAALGNMTVSLMKELEGTGITVNTVSPGLIATAEVRARFERLAQKRGWEGDWDAIQKKVAREVFPNFCGRIADVEEVGDLIAFLASDRAGYLNGANIRIDGGAADAVN